MKPFSTAQRSAASTRVRNADAPPLRVGSDGDLAHLESFPLRGEDQAREERSVSVEREVDVALLREEGDGVEVEAERAAEDLTPESDGAVVLG